MENFKRTNDSWVNGRACDTYLRRTCFYSLARDRDMQLAFELLLGRAWDAQYDHQAYDQSASAISF